MLLLPSWEYMEYAAGCFPLLLIYIYSRYLAFGKIRLTRYPSFRPRRLKSAGEK
jgi:hypothetical protein